MKTSITKSTFEDVVISRDRADVDFISKGFFAFTKNFVASFQDEKAKNYRDILGTILCYDAYKLYVKDNPDSFYLKDTFGYDFCFDDDLPILPRYRRLLEGDIFNIETLIDLDLSKYGLDDPNATTYLATILIELDPL